VQFAKLHDCPDFCIFRKPRNICFNVSLRPLAGFLRAGGPTI